MSDKSLKNPELFDRYAPDVIGGHPEHFDAVEVNGVREYGTENIEVDNANPDAFSVYLHYKTDESAQRVGMQCCGDFAQHNDALAYAKELVEQYPHLALYDHAGNAIEGELACDRMLDTFLLDAAKECSAENAISLLADWAGIHELTIANKAMQPIASSWGIMTPAMRVAALEGWRALERMERIAYVEPVNEEDEKAHRAFGLIIGALKLLKRVVVEKGMDFETKNELADLDIIIATQEDHDKLPDAIQELIDDVEADRVSMIITNESD
jgi:hypothetical protein